VAQKLDATPEVFSVVPTRVAIKERLGGKDYPRVEVELLGAKRFLL
jgi:hypothetical protein